MSLRNGRCDVCYRKLPEMEPDVMAKQEAASRARGDWEEDPSKRVTVCDPCWQRAIKRGWNPNARKPS